MPYHKFKYVKKERGCYYYRRRKFRKRLRGAPDTEQFLLSWTRIHEEYEKQPRRPADTISLPGSVRDLVIQYKRSSEYAMIGSGTKRAYNRYLDLVCDVFGEFDTAEVQMRHVLAARDTFADKPAKANDLVKLTRIIYGWGMPRGLVTHNPADFRSTSVKELPGGEHQPWPEPLIDRWLNEARPEAAWVGAGCIYTGQRIGDVLKMGWGAYKNNLIEVTQQKTKKSLVIPVHPELKKVLDIVPRRSVKIFTSFSGVPWTYSRWVEVQREERSRIGIGRLVSHGWRKNAVIRLLTAGCTVPQVSAITGQSHQMVEYYGKGVDQEALARVAMDKYAEWVENKKVVNWRTGEN